MPLAASRGRRFKSCPRYCKTAGQVPLLSQEGHFALGDRDQIRDLTARIWGSGGETAREGCSCLRRRGGCGTAMTGSISRRPRSGAARPTRPTRPTGGRSVPGGCSLYGRAVKRHFLFRRNFARMILRAARWKTAGTVPKRGVLFGAPHTSNWEWVLTMLLAWDSGIQVRLLVKQEFFRGPVAPVLRATGAIALDRRNPGATIRGLLVEAEVDEPFVLGIAAEGTRSKGEYGSPASTGSLSRAVCRSRWRFSMPPRARSAGGRPFLRPATCAPTWIGSVRSTQTRPA